MNKFCPNLNLSVDTLLSDIFFVSHDFREILKGTDRKDRLKIKYGKSIGEGMQGTVMIVESIDINGDCIYQLSPDGLPKYCIKFAKDTIKAQVKLFQEISIAWFLKTKDVIVAENHIIGSQGFIIKEYVRGESLTSICLRINQLQPKLFNCISRDVNQFLNKMARIFRECDLAKISLSPNNIILKPAKNRVECVIIDPAPVRSWNYKLSSFKNYLRSIGEPKLREYLEHDFIFQSELITINDLSSPADFFN
jgi:hypothetical protein